MDDETVREQARKRVDSKLALKKNFRLYVFVNVVCAVVNLLTSPGYLWFLWVVFGWGIAIAFQAWSVYGPRDNSGERERMIEEEITKMSSRDGSSDS